MREAHLPDNTPNGCAPLPRPGPLQVAGSELEFEGAPLRMEPKLDYIKRKEQERHARPNSPHQQAAAAQPAAAAGEQKVGGGGGGWGMRGPEWGRRHVWGQPACVRAARSLALQTGGRAGIWLLALARAVHVDPAPTPHSCSGGRGGWRWGAGRGGGRGGCGRGRGARRARVRGRLRAAL